MSGLELLKHVMHLAFMVQQVVFNASERERFRSDDPEELREKTLSVLEKVRHHLLSLNDEQLQTHELQSREVELRLEHLDGQVR